MAPNWGATTTAVPVPVRDAAYSHTPAGDVWSVTDTGAVDGVASSRSECFRYDGLGRVTEAWATSTACPAPVGGSPSVGAPAMTSTLTGWGRYQARYSYDTLGNRTSVTQRDDAATRTRSWVYPAPGAGVVRPHAPTSTSDQIGTATPTTQALAYTAAGQQTTRLKASASGSGGPPHTGAVAGQTVAYDAEGRVSQVTTGTTTTRWAYDADGALLIKDDGTTRTVYLGAGGGGREVSRVTATGVRSTVEVRSVGGVTVTETGTETPTSATAGLPTSAKPAQAVSTSVVTVTDPHTTGVLQLNGVTLAETGRRYTDPFGSPIASPGVTARTWTGDRGYGNHPSDTSSGLTQVGARVYDPAAGMFTSPDPIINPGNPNQMHGVYTYAHHNPLAMSDPTGLEPRPIHANSGQGKFSATAKANHATSARYTGQAHATATSRPAARGGVATTRSPQSTAAARPVAPPRSGGSNQRGWTGQQQRDFARAVGDVAWDAGPGTVSFLLRHGAAGPAGIAVGGWLDPHENRAKSNLDSWGGGRTDTRTNRSTYATLSVAVIFIPGPKTTAATRTTRLLAANTAGGGAETFFRTMSKENFAELQATGRVPATSETFISPSAGFSSAYEGQMVQLSVRPGTTSSLASMGVRDGSAAASSAFPNMPLVSSGWTSTSAFFKGEGKVVNIGLGRGSALNTFNDSILSWQAVP